MNTNTKLSAFALVAAIGIWVGGGCISTTENPDGSSTTSAGGMDIVTTNADGTSSVSPGVAGAVGLLPPPWGSLAVWGAGLLPWVLNRRSRKQLIAKPLKQIRNGDIGGAVTSVLAGIGIGHSEPDPVIAFEELRVKLVEDGLVDDASGKSFAMIEKAAPDRVHVAAS